ncbi:serine protease [Tulasnella sp. 418]|nr:serine protease [Tulasnella sp. 418]
MHKVTAIVLVFAAHSLASPLSTYHLVERQIDGGLSLAPLLTSSIPESHIENSYIVVLKDGVDLTSHTNLVMNAHSEDSSDLSGLKHVYDGQIKGYAGQFSSSTIHKLRAMAEVDYNDVDEDANGHGTHCAGTIASRKYGVAKAANIVAVKVLGSNGSGTMSDVLSGVVWAATQAAEKKAKAQAEYAATGKTSHKGSVANMSLGGGKSRALDDAVNKAVDSGLHFAVAAGNENKDACNTSPAGAEKAITVGASTLADTRAYFSNFGPCVDVFAPGLNILSTWKGSETATNTISGTSMASPRKYKSANGDQLDPNLSIFRRCWSSCLLPLHLSLRYL